MKEITVDWKNTWHYRLATYYAYLGNQAYAHDPDDFCEYVRKTFKGLFLLVFVMACAAYVFVSPLGDLLAWLTVSIQQGMMLSIDDVGMRFIILLTIVLAFPLIAAGVYLICKWLDKDKLDKPSFSGMLYSKFKDKACFKISYKKTIMEPISPVH